MKKLFKEFVLEIKTYFFQKGFIKYFLNTSWLFLEQTLRILSGIFVGVLVARHLGPEKFGTLSYLLAITGVLAGISKLGIDSVLVRDLVNYPNKKSLYLGTAFWLKLLGAFTALGLLAVILLILNTSKNEKILIFILSAGIVFQSFDVIDSYFQSLVRSKITSTCKIIQITLSLMLKIYLIHVKADLIWFVMVSLLDTLSLALSLFIAYKIEKGLYFFSCFNYDLAKKIIRDSLPLLLSSLIVSIYMRVDQIMIKEMLGDQQVGIYSVAVRLTEVFYFLPIIVSTSLFPAILNTKKYSEELYLLRLQKLYNLMTWLAITLALLMTFLSDYLIFKLFGHEFEDTAQILKINIWASVFVFGGVSASKWIISENLQKYSNYFLLFGMLSNLMLNLILIPKLGLVGSALATLISQIIAAIIAPAIFKQTRLQAIMLLKSFAPIISNSSS